MTDLATRLSQRAAQIKGAAGVKPAPKYKALEDIFLGNQTPYMDGIAPDLKGKYTGSGTHRQNSDGQLFNTKESIVITPEVAEAMNAKLQRLIDQGGNTGLSMGDQYFTSVQEYIADPLARLFVPGAGSSLNEIYLPGSDEQWQNKMFGEQAGLVQIHNPTKNSPGRRGSGFVRPGSVGFNKALRDITSGNTGYTTESALAHFVGQAGVYGLGELYRQLGINVHAVNEPLIIPEGGRRMQAVPFNQHYDFSFYNPETLNQIDGDKWQLLRNVLGSLTEQGEELYRAKFKDPMNTRIGHVGAATLGLRNTELFGYSNENQPALDEWSNSLIKAFKAKGSVKGLLKYAEPYKENTDRRGQTVWSLRKNGGESVGVATTWKAGYCPPEASMIGVTQQISPGGAGGYRPYVRKRKHIGKDGQDYGTTYYCDSAPTQSVDPRRDIYQAGGIRGGKLGVKAALEARGLGQAFDLLVNKYQEGVDQRKGLIQDITTGTDAERNAALRKMAKLGVNPVFVTPSGENMGKFASFKKTRKPGPSLLWAPTEWRQQSLMPKLGKASTSLGFNDLKAQQALARLNLGAEEMEE